MRTLATEGLDLLTAAAMVALAAAAFIAAGQPRPCASAAIEARADATAAAHPHCRGSRASSALTPAAMREAAP